MLFLPLNPEKAVLINKRLVIAILFKNCLKTVQIIKIMKFSLIIHTLNEIQGCKIIIPRIDRSLFDEIIVVDGGSTDGTLEYLQEQNLKIVHQTQKYSRFEITFLKRNLTDAYLLGVKHSRNDYVIMPFTPDVNMTPEKLPDLINKVKEGYEMVIVSRYKDGAKSYDDTLISGFGNWLFTTSVNLLFGGKFTDLLGGFRCWNKHLIKKFDINIRIAIHTQLAIGCIRNNIPYAEIGADEPKRIGGISQLNPLINGSWEVITIVEAFFNRTKYKIKK